MMTVDRKGDYHWKQPWAAENRPQQDPPVLKSFPTKDTQTDAGADEGQQALKVQR